MRAGYELNAPLRPLAAPPGNGPLEKSTSWFQVGSPDVIVETVKQAEHGRGLVVRLYEAAGASTRTELRCGFDVAQAVETNLIEEDPVAVESSGSTLRLDFRPFEIRTLRLLSAR